MITGDTIVQQGLDKFPEARAGYDAMLKKWEGGFPGIYNVYSEVFRPVFIEGLEQTNKDLTTRFGAFFEEIFSTGDLEAQNVVWLKFFKWLFARENEFERFLPFCGTHTRTAMRDAASRWNVSSSIRLKLLC